MFAEKVSERRRFKLNELVLDSLVLGSLREHKFYNIVKMKTYHGNKLKIYLCLQVTQYQFTILKI